MFRRHKTQWIAAVVAVTTIPALWWFLRSQDRVFEETQIAATQQQLLAIARSQADRLEAVLHNIRAELWVLAQHPTVRQAARDGLSARDLLASNGYSPEMALFDHIRQDASSLYRLDAKGVVQSRLPHKADQIGQDFSDKPGVRHILTGHKTRHEHHVSSCGKAFISKMFTTDSGKPAFSICAAMFGDDDRLIGVVRALINLDTINEQTSHVQVGEKGHAWIVDDDRIMLCHPDRKQCGTDIMAVRRQAFPDFDWSQYEQLLGRMAAGQTGVATYYSTWWDEEQPRMVRKLAGFAPVRVGNKLWSVSVSMSYDEIAGPINAHSRAMLLVGSMLLLAFVGAGSGFYLTHRKKTELARANQLLKTEIAERKRAEETLQESEERYRHLFENLNDAALLADAETGRIVEANQQAEVLLGRARHEIVGMHQSELHPPNKADEYRQMFASHIEKGTAAEHDTEVIRKDGALVPVTISASTLTASGHDFILGLFADDTERKEAEATLLASEGRHRAITETAKDAIITSDSKGNILFWNSAAEKIFGYGAEEMIGRNMMGCIVPPQYHEAKRRGLAHFARTGLGDAVGKTLELTALRKDGSEFPIEISVSGYRDGDDHVATAVIRDISERKRAEEALLEQAELLESKNMKLEGQRQQLRAQQEELLGVNATLAGANETAEAANRELEGTNRQLQEATERANEMAVAAEVANVSKSAFLANMSHEIRTPMTAILGFAENLLDPDMPESERSGAANTIRRNGEHLLRIINDILDLSKIEAGRLEVERKRCSPRQLVADVQSLMQVRAEAKNLALDVEFVGAIPETIETDPTRLRQILINLVGNAIKFTETGSVRLVTRLVDDEGTGPMMRFDVIDTGVGMAQEQVRRLFEPFMQVDASTSRKFGGTGLGLTISKRLAATLGGDISVESMRGQGSTFRVTIATGPLDNVMMLDNPLDEGVVKTESHEKAAAMPRPDRLDRLRCRILLAEDGPDNQRLISFVLEKAGAQVTVAENGQIALDRALAARDEGNPFDVILMDMEMPVLDGYEATRRLRNKGYTGPIVALTAHAMASDREKCLDAGCDDFATKPVDRHELIGMIVSHLEHLSELPVAPASHR